MKKMVLLLGMAVVMQAFTVYAADENDPTYVDVKAGMFLPNGKSDGLKSFDTGYAVDVAVGIKPAPYAAVELATGFFSASGDNSDATGKQDMTAYGVPVMLNVKANASFRRLDLMAGVGAGYVFCFMDNDVYSTTLDEGKSESVHGSAFGYQVLAGADYRIDDNWSAGVQFKWFSTRPELQIATPTSLTNAKKQKIEFGGTTLSAGFKYNF